MASQSAGPGPQACTEDPGPRAEAGARQAVECQALSLTRSDLALGPSESVASASAPAASMSQAVERRPEARSRHRRRQGRRRARAGSRPKMYHARRPVRKVLGSVAFPTAASRRRSVRTTAPGTTGWPKRAPPQIAFCRVFLRTEQRSLALKPQHREFPTLTRLVHGMLRYRTKTTAIGQKPG